MDKTEFEQLADERLLDAQTLLGAGRYAGAYYLAGYSVECALKACVVKWIEQNPGYIFEDKKFSADCFTHNLQKLVDLAGLEVELSAAQMKSRFATNWDITKDWNEKERYTSKTQQDAVQLITAISDRDDGVLPWIRTFW